MRELSLNILDIAQNSVAANARKIIIKINAHGNLLSVSIKDDGKGMAPDFLKKVIDPFTTTRTTRKVGLGIPLFKMAAETSGGDFKIESTPGIGTTVTATFRIDHIDRMPLGDVAATMTSLIMTSPHIDFVLEYSVEERMFTADTAEIKQTLEGVPIESPEVIAFIGEYIKENISEVNGGVLL